jgi:hypothetical protein
MIAIGDLANWHGLSIMAYQVHRGAETSPQATFILETMPI